MGGGVAAQEDAATGCELSVFDGYHEHAVPHRFRSRPNGVAAAHTDGPFRIRGLGESFHRHFADNSKVVSAALRGCAADISRDGPPTFSNRAYPVPKREGKYRSAIKRMPRFADDMEIIYVEGHSSDGTFEECERVRDAYAGTWNIRVAQQDGKGKGDAVRKGFEMASKDIQMILDADLTVAPEDLPKFYEAIAAGTGEFINGTRLVYPMEQGAMRFLNYWANRTFALIFSFLLNQRFTDTLCGTKSNFEDALQSYRGGTRVFRRVRSVWRL